MRQLKKQPLCMLSIIILKLHDTTWDHLRDKTNVLAHPVLGRQRLQRPPDVSGVAPDASPEKRSREVAAWRRCNQLYWRIWCAPDKVHRIRIAKRVAISLENAIRHRTYAVLHQTKHRISTVLPWSTMARPMAVTWLDVCMHRTHPVFT
jgi:hypothetical protein